VPKARRYPHGIQLDSWTLSEFQNSCKEVVLKDVKKQDLVDFVAYMKDRELADRTISNRLVDVVTFLRWNGIENVKLSHKYTDKIVKTYHPDDLKLLFCACAPEEWLVFQFFLTTGAREQEVMHACWRDIDFKDGVYTIRDHPQWDFATKDHAEREIPLPSYMIEKLKAHTRTSELIFPTKQGLPNGHFLRILKDVAKRAGVNPQDCGLHKFRKSFATLQHEKGLSVRTIQKLLGHESLISSNEVGVLGTSPQGLPQFRFSVFRNLFI
jgi:integrase/recombinase XerD